VLRAHKVKNRIGTIITAPNVSVSTRGGLLEQRHKCHRLPPPPFTNELVPINDDNSVFLFVKTCFWTLEFFGKQEKNVLINLHSIPNLLAHYECDTGGISIGKRKKERESNRLCPLLISAGVNNS
jgi:hypothetical protein